MNSLEWIEHVDSGDSEISPVEKKCSECPGEPGDTNGETQIFSRSSPGISPSFNTLIYREKNKIQGPNKKIVPIQNNIRDFREIPGEPGEDPETPIPCLTPSNPIPEEWIESMATFPGTETDPHWRDHPDIKRFRERGRLVGWRRNGKPIYESELGPTPKNAFLLPSS